MSDDIDLVKEAERFVKIERKGRSVLYNDGDVRLFIEGGHVMVEDAVGCKVFMGHGSQSVFVAHALALGYAMGIQSGKRPLGKAPFEGGPSHEEIASQLYDLSKKMGKENHADDLKE